MDLGFGADNLFHSDKAKVKLRFSVLNVTNKDALYNFLSTFTGTHFVTPARVPGACRSGLLESRQVSGRRRYPPTASPPY